MPINRQEMLLERIARALERMADSTERKDPIEKKVRTKKKDPVEEEE